MITPEQAQVFVDITKRYFEKTFKKEEHRINVCSPYLIDKEEIKNVAGDFSGIIHISGVSKGVVMFTASKDILESILNVMGEPVINNLMLSDLAGELANIISGNAREEFGGKFIISCPDIVEGVPSEELFYSGNSYVIPLKWEDRFAALVISMDPTITLVRDR